MSRRLGDHVWLISAGHLGGSWSPGGYNGGSVDRCQICGLQRYKSSGKRMYVRPRNLDRGPESLAPRCREITDQISRDLELRDKQGSLRVPLARDPAVKGHTPASSRGRA